MTLAHRERGPRTLFVALVLTLLAGARVAAAQSSTQTVKPHFLVVFDTSGSMDYCTLENRDPDGPGGACTMRNSCNAIADRMNDAKCVLGKMVGAYGDVVFGLERFGQVCSGNCSSSSVLNQSNFCDCDGVIGTCNNCNSSNGNNCPSTGASADRGQMLVPITDQNHSNMHEWVNFSCGTCGTAIGNAPELGYGNRTTWTPLAGSLRAARRYFEGMDPNYGTSPISGDSFASCRPKNVILLTDGDETCSAFSNTTAAATELRTTSFGGQSYDIKTYVIGFGQPPGDSGIEAIATAGGTDAPGANRGFYATNETTLSLAFSQIIADSLLTERCNGLDDNCNGACDESFPEVGVLATPAPGKTCNNARAAQTCSVGTGACKRDGVYRCAASGTGIECVNATTGVVLTPGTPGTETCPPNNVDDDCDGVIDDQGPCTNCTPEICNGVDDDCDMQVDEPSDVFPCPTNAANPDGCVCPGGRSCANTADLAFCSCAPRCGTEEGECTRGRLACGRPTPGANIQLYCTGGQGPVQETCNCKDDDCNGAIDDDPTGEGAACSGLAPGLSTTPPAQCRPGRAHCTNNGGGSCTFVCGGEIGPSAEVCDAIDNDCDGMVDEGAPCATGLTCISGHCAQNCNVSEQPCPPGTRCVDTANLNDCNPIRNDCICISNPCLSDCDLSRQTCTISGGRAVCTDRCPPGKCSSAQTCDPGTGLCTDCTMTGCPQNEACVLGQCTPDPCAQVSCPADQFCTGGSCVKHCSGVTCLEGEICEAGECKPRPACLNASCGAEMICNPGSGMCTMDLCLSGCAQVGQKCVQASGMCITDPCATTHCPACNSCSLTYDGKADCRPINGCQAPATYTIATEGGGGLSCSATFGRAEQKHGGLRQLAGLALFLLGMATLGRRRRGNTSKKGAR